SVRNCATGIAARNASPTVSDAAPNSHSQAPRNANHTRRSRPTKPSHSTGVAVTTRAIGSTTAGSATSASTTGPSAGTATASTNGPPAPAATRPFLMPATTPPAGP